MYGRIQRARHLAALRRRCSCEPGTQGPKGAAAVHRTASGTAAMRWPNRGNAGGQQRTRLQAALLHVAQSAAELNEHVP